MNKQDVELLAKVVSLLGKAKFDSVDYNFGVDLYNTIVKVKALHGKAQKMVSEENLAPQTPTLPEDKFKKKK